jgi:outer membrane immunogenic protein
MSVDDIGGAFVLPPPGNFVAGGHDSGVAGFHFGAQHQWGGFVLGIEAGGRFSLDGDFASARGTGIAPPSGCNAVVALACEGRLDKILQIGPRLGWAGDKWLVYGTGGYARAEIDTRARTIATGVIVSDLSEVHRGWFLGAGVEFALTRNLILGVEYTRYDFDDKTHFDAIIPGNSRFVSADVDMVTARLSYKFGREECCAPLK